LVTSKRKTRNPEMRAIDRSLRKMARENEAPIWSAVREMLVVPKRRRISVNISRINRNSSEGDTLVIPGKVLSYGDLDHKATIAAYDFSQTAIDKIVSSGGEAISIEDLIRRNPKGSGVKIIA
jgi:large subunit ribosomal protein L18e